MPSHPNESSSVENRRKYVEVAIAIVFDRATGQVLICKRKADAVLAGYWEFPGGKCDQGETPETCAAREVLEETALSVEILRKLPIIEHEYPYAHVRLHPFLCHWREGELQLLAVAEAQWIPPAEIVKYQFPEANRELVQAVAAGFDCLMGSPTQ